MVWAMEVEKAESEGGGERRVLKAEESKEKAVVWAHNLLSDLPILLGGVKATLDLGEVTAQEHVRTLLFTCLLESKTAKRIQMTGETKRD